MCARTLSVCVLSSLYSLYPFLFLLSLSLAFSLSLCPSLSISLCLSLCLPLSLSLYPSLSLPFSLSLSLFLSTPSLSLPFPLSTSLFLLNPLSLSLTLFLFLSTLSLYLSLSLSFSLSPSPSLSLSNTLLTHCPWESTQQTVFEPYVDISMKITINIIYFVTTWIAHLQIPIASVPTAPCITVHALNLPNKPYLLWQFI